MRILLIQLLFDTHTQNKNKTNNLLTVSKEKTHKNENCKER